AVQSASGIKNLEQSTVAQSTEFAYKNQQVVSRVERLVETSKLTGELLSQKIQATTDKMLKFETQVITEIEHLSSVTKDKSATIEASVDSNKAKILKLQSVDEAIIKRATMLEISSAELTVKSQEMQASAEQLRLTTNDLSRGLDALVVRTRELEAIAESHGSMIGVLQKAGAELSDKLIILAGREGRHFNIFSVSFLLLLIVTAVIYFSQQSQFDRAEAVTAEQAKLTETKIMSLQQSQADDVAIADHSLVALESKVDKKLQTIQDQVQSVEARFNNSAPFSQIGNDNIIHGPQWIAGLPGDHYTVQLAYVGDTSVMYELAEQYNHYLKNSLSYFAVDENGKKKYVLLSGDYATSAAATAAINTMPRYIGELRPMKRKLSDIQRYIAR
ncbi:MAG: SPOR domain-containing protein, partial [Gammaproteobacteria bacterium]|nr:SPOR domain-containing protein [Gammaproteobacteria bacterium]